MKTRFKKLDFTLMFTPLALSLFGLVMIYSASMVLAVYQGLDSNYYLIKQIQWISLGAFVLFFFAFVPYQKYQRIIKLIVIGMLLLLIFVFPFGGDAVNNAKSWYDFKVFRFQPAELAKLGLILYLASVYSKKQSYIHDFGKAVIPPLILTAITVALIVFQPDIGTASIILLIALSVIVSSGIRMRHLMFLATIGVLFVALAIPALETEERVSRFTGAYEPFSDPTDTGFHLIQSYLAIGSGGLTGVGLGDSVQKLGYLSEPHTDFILAVIAEELGLVGVAITIGLLATIVIRGLYIANKCEDAFGSLLAIGISCMIGIQAIINIGAMSGALPITGVTLPFVSYGGSSLLISLVSMGILNNIAMQVKSKQTFTKTRSEVPKQTYEQKPSIVSMKERRGNTWAK
ncbi:putative lipid II flippase FtsW [Salinibacillus xinjiangensis]|uniref:Probable peptidoglycan glycosyltransferase FtsW n=1 Tax=Salinibacillus xinjiangensis TaxID=1229268 RepID=A0A6G1X3Q5_9BACI|nr:putative lipid II flippase FtsW [Salinibacillus xinjiangensis]MRG85536.1 putative lipid II flippase FtsW [Salinibacillus xinjiangensis]